MIISKKGMYLLLFVSFFAYILILELFLQIKAAEINNELIEKYNTISTINTKEIIFVNNVKFIIKKTLRDKLKFTRNENLVKKTVDNKLQNFLKDYNITINPNHTSINLNIYNFDGKLYVDAAYIFHRKLEKDININDYNLKYIIPKEAKVYANKIKAN